MADPIAAELIPAVRRPQKMRRWAPSHEIGLSIPCGIRAKTERQPCRVDSRSSHSNRMRIACETLSEALAPVRSDPTPDSSRLRGLTTVMIMPSLRRQQVTVGLPAARGLLFFHPARGLRISFCVSAGAQVSRWILSVSLTSRSRPAALRADLSCFAEAFLVSPRHNGPPRRIGRF